MCPLAEDRCYYNRRPGKVNPLFSNFLKNFQAAPETPEPPRNLWYEASAATVTTAGIAAPTVVPAAAVVVAAAASTGVGPTIGTTAAEEDDEDQDDPQTAVATPTIVTPHKSEPPSQS